ncbi:hypothetical protein [Rahnella sp. PD4]|uniref:hypothetical protein n=1 Tax=Rahnella sp. PD4 TaxID=3368611 RepID=UPI003BA158E6
MPLPKTGDLIYGLHTDFGRKRYMYSVKGFQNGVITADVFKVLRHDQPCRLAEQASLEHFISSHIKYCSALNGERNNENLRRKCKAIIEWAVSKGRNIHFVLDELDITAVANKSYRGINPDENKPEKNRSITGSELRHIYRNWQKFKNNVYFWFEQTPVSPPWEQDIVMDTLIKKNRRLQLSTVVHRKEVWAAYNATVGLSRNR